MCLHFQDLKQDWRVGAEVFESLLIDHDWAVNYCNWNYFAGIGNDPRDRHFNTVSQGLQYDPDAALVKAWVPELVHLPAELAHQPWGCGSEEVGIGENGYPAPLVEPSTQITRPRKAKAGRPE